MNIRGGFSCGENRQIRKGTLEKTRRVNQAVDFSLLQLVDLLRDLNLKKENFRGFPSIFRREHQRLLSLVLNEASDSADQLRQ